MQTKVLSAPPMSPMDKRTTKHIQTNQVLTFLGLNVKKEKEKEEKEHGETIKGPPPGGA